MDFEAEVIIEAFNRFAVNYVVIGAFAAIAQNVPIPPTMDIDFFAASDDVNLRRLSGALDYLDAKIRVRDMEEGVTFDRSPSFLKQMQMLNLTCSHGDFDVLFNASGFENFDELERGAVTVIVGHTETSVASVEDIARSKRVAGRVKDLKVLHIFERYLRGQENDHGMEK